MISASAAGGGPAQRRFCSSARSSSQEISVALTKHSFLNVRLVTSWCTSGLSRSTSRRGSRRKCPSCTNTRPSSDQNSRLLCTPRSPGGRPAPRQRRVQPASDERTLPTASTTDMHAVADAIVRLLLLTASAARSSRHLQPGLRHQLPHERQRLRVSTRGLRWPRAAPPRPRLQRCPPQTSARSPASDMPRAQHRRARSRRARRAAGTAAPCIPPHILRSLQQQLRFVHQAALGNGLRASQLLHEPLNVPPTRACVRPSAAAWRNASACDLASSSARALASLPLQQLARGGAFGVGHVVQPVDLLPHMPPHLDCRMASNRSGCTRQCVPTTTTLASGTLAASSCSHRFSGDTMSCSASSCAAPAFGELVRRPREHVQAAAA